MFPKKATECSYKEICDENAAARKDSYKQNLWKGKFFQ